ncbi:hypothetical protein BS47DRAFT_1359084 [Hydnum rufescens UP504]|uniref:Uncharacterized protein n=1 Tax=Hydnum rufescens UP504 TaxID=1448309 RepID=A0A9P6B662_9AGAM|nr:hypothetical protein BS47DRAFT_1359084 [Hydnum rufescens UP504]
MSLVFSQGLDYVIQQLAQFANSLRWLGYVTLTCPIEICQVLWDLGTLIDMSVYPIILATPSLSPHSATHRRPRFQVLPDALALSHYYYYNPNPNSVVSIARRHSALVDPKVIMAPNANKKKAGTKAKVSTLKVQTFFILDTIPVVHMAFSPRAWVDLPLYTWEIGIVPLTAIWWHDKHSGYVLETKCNNAMSKIRFYSVKDMTRDGLDVSTSFASVHVLLSTFTSEANAISAGFNKAPAMFCNGSSPTKDIMSSQTVSYTDALCDFPEGVYVPSPLPPYFDHPFLPHKWQRTEGIVAEGGDIMMEDGGDVSVPAVDGDGDVVMQDGASVAATTPSSGAAMRSLHNQLHLRDFGSQGEFSPASADMVVGENPKTLHQPLTWADWKGNTEPALPTPLENPYMGVKYYDTWSNQCENEFLKDMDEYKVDPTTKPFPVVKRVEWATLFMNSCQPFQYTEQCPPECKPDIYTRDQVSIAHHWDKYGAPHFYFTNYMRLPTMYSMQMPYISYISRCIDDPPLPASLDMISSSDGVKLTDAYHKQLEDFVLRNHEQYRQWCLAASNLGIQVSLATLITPVKPQSLGESPFSVHLLLQSMPDELAMTQLMTMHWCIDHISMVGKTDCPHFSVDDNLIRALYLHSNPGVWLDDLQAHGVPLWGLWFDDAGINIKSMQHLTGKEISQEELDPILKEKGNDIHYHMVSEQLIVESDCLSPWFIVLRSYPGVPPHKALEDIVLNALFLQYQPRPPEEMCQSLRNIVGDGPFLPPSHYASSSATHFSEGVTCDMDEALEAEPWFSPDNDEEEAAQEEEDALDRSIQLSGKKKGKLSNFDACILEGWRDPNSKSVARNAAKCHKRLGLDKDSGSMSAGSSGSQLPGIVGTHAGSLHVDSLPPEHEIVIGIMGTIEVMPSTPVPTGVTPSAPVSTEEMPSASAPTGVMPSAPVSTEVTPSTPPTGAVPSTPVSTEATPSAPAPTGATPSAAPPIEAMASISTPTETPPIKLVPSHTKSVMVEAEPAGVSVPTFPAQNMTPEVIPAETTPPAYLWVLNFPCILVHVLDLPCILVDVLNLPYILAVVLFLPHLPAHILNLPHIPARILNLPHVLAHVLPPPYISRQVCDPHCILAHAHPLPHVPAHVLGIPLSPKGGDSIIPSPKRMIIIVKNAIILWVPHSLIDGLRGLQNQHSMGVSTWGRPDPTFSAFWRGGSQPVHGLCPRALTTTFGPTHGHNNDWGSEFCASCGGELNRSSRGGTLTGPNAIFSVSGPTQPISSWVGTTTSSAVAKGSHVDLTSSSQSIPLGRWFAIVAGPLPNDGFCDIQLWLDVYPQVIAVH